MPLAADALQPFIVEGLLSTSGRTAATTLAEVITAPKAGYDFSVVDATKTVILDFRESTAITAALASDCGRFSSASFQSAAYVAVELTEGDKFAWALVKLYYSAFYAGHALIRVLGEGCSFFYKKHTEHLSEMCATVGIKPTFRIEAGLYHCLLNDNATAISFLRARGTAGGAHESFWLIFGNKLRAVSEEILRGDLTRVDAQNVFSQFDQLLQIIGRQGGYSWLSRVRNDLQYQHAHEAWYPSKVRPRKREALGRLAAQWTGEPMVIDMHGGQLGPFGLLGDFVSSCAFIISLCRDILLRIADSSSEGARSFVRVGPLALLNHIQG